MNANRVLAKKVLPEELFADPSALLARLGGPHGDAWLERKWAYACAFAQEPMGEPFPKRVAVSPEGRAVLVQVPRADAPNDTAFACVAVTAKGPRVFFFERTTDGAMTGVSPDEGVLAMLEPGGTRASFGFHAGLDAASVRALLEQHVGPLGPVAGGGGAGGAFGAKPAGGAFGGAAAATTPSAGGAFGAKPAGGAFESTPGGAFPAATGGAPSASGGAFPAASGGAFPRASGAPGGARELPPELAVFLAEQGSLGHILRGMAFAVVGAGVLVAIALWALVVPGAPGWAKLTTLFAPLALLLVGGMVYAGRRSRRRAYHLICHPGTTIPKSPPRVAKAGTAKAIRVRSQLRPS